MPASRPVHLALSIPSTSTTRYDGVDARSSMAKAHERPVEVRGCTCSCARRLARRFTAIYDRCLAPCGLKVTQFSLLSRLAWNDGLSMSALADSLELDRTTLTRNLKPLLDAGLVTLLRSDVDGRQREVRLTDLGRTRQVEAKRLWRAAQNEINRTLGPSQTASLHALFDGLIATLDEHAGASSP